MTHLLPFATPAILRQQIFSTPFSPEDNSDICALTATHDRNKKTAALSTIRWRSRIGLSGKDDTILNISRVTLTGDIGNTRKKVSLPERAIQERQNERLNQ